MHPKKKKKILEGSPSKYRINLVAKVIDFWLLPNFHINTFNGQFIAARGVQSFQPFDGDRAVHITREIVINEFTSQKIQVINVGLKLYVNFNGRLTGSLSILDNSYICRT